MVPLHDRQELAAVQEVDLLNGVLGSVRGRALQWGQVVDRWSVVWVPVVELVQRLIAGLHSGRSAPDGIRMHLHRHARLPA